MQRFFVILSAALTLLISSAVTLAAETGGNAAACKPANQADVANLAFLTSGVSNNGTSSALAVCGMVRLPGSSLTTLTAEYIDNSETAQLTCVARLALEQQVQFVGADQDQRDSNQGANTFQWSLPANVFGYVDLQCSIPAKVGSSVSLLRGFGCNSQP